MENIEFKNRIYTLQMDMLYKKILYASVLFITIGFSLFFLTEAPDEDFWFSLFGVLICFGIFYFFVFRRSIVTLGLFTALYTSSFLISFFDDEPFDFEYLDLFLYGHIACVFAMFYIIMKSKKASKN